MSSSNSKLEGSIVRDVLWSPLTWGPFLVPMGVFAFTKAGTLLNAGLFAATAALVGGSWLAFLPRLRNLYRAERLQKDKDRIQNTRTTFVKSLRKRHFGKYADIIEEAIVIEGRIRQKMQKSSSPAFTEIEETAESLLEEIITQVNKVIELTGQYRRAPKHGKRELKEELLEREGLLNRAKEALGKTEENIGSYQHSKQVTSKDRLANLIGKMEEEEKLISRVQARISSQEEDYAPLTEEDLQD